MIRVLIADDHELIREGLRKVFRHASDIEVVAEARDAPGAVTAAREEQVDVAIIDFNMPGRSGLDALRQIRALRPAPAVLILSMLPEERFAVRVLRAGAAGFVSKDSAAAEIVEAVRRVAGGERYVSPAAVTQLALAVGRPGETPHEALSDREMQVLLLIAAGKGTRAIAEELSLSVNTIATYRRGIFAKLSLRSDVEIARYAIEHKLLG